MIEEPKTIDPKETKIERLEQVIDDLLNQLPTGIKLLTQNFINQSQLFRDEEGEDKINLFIEKTRGILDYVEHGNIAAERTLSEVHQDQT